MSQKRSIKPLAPRVCPQCGGEKTFEINATKIECGVCGYTVRGKDARPVKPSQHANPSAKEAVQSAPPPAAQRDLSKFKVSYFIANRHEIPDYVEAAYSTAMDYVNRQDWPNAIHNLRRCIDFERDFIEAHLWLGRLLEDETERREHVTSVLALNPSHAEALHELMILNGEIDPNITFTEFTEAQQRETEGAVVGSTANVKCPNCGSSNMSDDEASGTLYCESCGHRMEKKTRANTGMRSFSRANLKRRVQETVWKFGERLIQCNSCGAKRTVSKSQLTQTCPFCGSRHIIKTDALGTFEQPDSIVPFAVSERQAMAKVEEKLNSRAEKLKGWFVDNRVERQAIEGVFLPFWVFDTVIEVSRTTIDLGTRDRPAPRVNIYNEEKLSEMMNNVLVPGVDSPPRTLLNQIGRFDLKKGVKYTPEMIAQHSAEIYVRDFDKAAMDVHEIVGTSMRKKYHTNRDREEVQVNVSSMIKHMSFTLMLLPVWSVTIFEKDGDVRPVLVNGQTGHAVLGKAKKPD